MERDHRDTASDLRGYRRFRHSLAYLAPRSAACTASDPMLMSACGYATRHAAKLSWHRREWDALRRAIPLAYLTTIGATLKELSRTEKADMADYYAGLAQAVTPEGASERAALFCGRNIPLPVGITEAEAVEVIRRYSLLTQHECSISFYGLKYIRVYPNGNATTTFFPPSLAVIGRFLVPTERSSDAETCGLG